MSPFDLPPSTPPVSFDPPPPGRRSAGRTAAVAAASVVLIAAGVLAVAQFAPGGDSEVANAAQVGDDTSGAAPATSTPETTPAPPTTVPAGGETPAGTSSDDPSDLDGKIVIQIGDGDPIVIDLGDLGILGDIVGGNGDLGKIEQCLGDLSFDLGAGGGPGGLSIPGLPGLFGDGDDLTVAGPDGLSVLDFGDGDGSVTITKKDGEITITSEGDVQVDDLAAPDVSVPLPSLPALPDFDQIYECLEDASG